MITIKIMDGMESFKINGAQQVKSVNYYKNTKHKLLKNNETILKESVNNNNNTCIVLYCKCAIR
jgi:hypothetical protein